jgi:hypothetical protein
MNTSQNKSVVFIIHLESGKAQAIIVLSLDYIIIDSYEKHGK